MGINFLYICPEFPPNYKNFIIELSKLGINVFGIGQSEFYELKEELRHLLRWYVCSKNLENFEAFSNSIDFLNNIMVTNNWGKIDIVESHNEYWMKHEAFLNEKLNLTGIKLIDILKLRKKSEMKKIFYHLGLSPVKGYLVKSPSECLTASLNLNYPLILKPNEGVGAKDTYKINNYNELKEVSKRISNEYLIEEFIEGRMTTFDGLTDKDGRVIFSSSLIYGCGVLDNVMGEDTFFYTRKFIPQELSDIGEKLIEAFGIKKKFFHFEFFEKDNRFMPVEINARPPGGAIIDMMNYSADIDLYKAYAEMIAGKLKTKITATKKYFCAYVGRKNKNYAHSNDEIFKTCGHMLAEHGINPSLYWDGMGHERFIFRSYSENDIFKLRDFILMKKKAEEVA